MHSELNQDLKDAKSCIGLFDLRVSKWLLSKRIYRYLHGSQAYWSICTWLTPSVRRISSSMTNWPVKVLESLQKIAYAASATISGLRECRAESLPESISMAAVRIAAANTTSHVKSTLNNQLSDESIPLPLILDLYTRPSLFLFPLY